MMHVCQGMVKRKIDRRLSAMQSIAMQCRFPRLIFDGNGHRVLLESLSLSIKRARKTSLFNIY